MMTGNPLTDMDDLLRKIPPDRPVLIAGPTASGKSALALALARSGGGVIVNADALQVYSSWCILSARPGPADEAAAPHRLYGHIGPREAYSVGHWLREVEALLAGPGRLIVVGGTGLYFTALTGGLAEIPPTPPDIRAEADAIRLHSGTAELLSALDEATLARIDQLNPMRVQRAWEVQRATGRGLADWQDQTGPALLPPEACARLLIEAPPDWLNPRIEARFDAMLAAGALDEVRGNLGAMDPGLPSSRVIGAPELADFLQGKKTLDAAREAAIVSTRQYAKRQRTWFRARMTGWTRVWANTGPDHGI